MSLIQSTLNLVVAKPKDVPEVVQMVESYHRYDHLDFDENLSRQLLLQLVENPSTGIVWLIQASEQTVGYLILTFGFSLEFKGRNAFIDELFIKEKWRGKGIGSQALEFAKTAARNLGVQALHLEVYTRNKNAVLLYERSGFQDPGRALMTCWLSGSDTEAQPSTATQ